MTIETGRPRVRINQLGYLLGHPMQATLVCEHAEPVDVVVRDHDDAVVYTGRSVPWPVRPEPTPHALSRERRPPIPGESRPNGRASRCLCCP